jgi:catecholate siderophore receptor
MGLTEFNERNTDIDTANAYLLSGKRHNALEFEVAAASPRRMCLRASVSLAVIDKTGSNAAGLAEVGQNPGLSPSRQANLFTTYRSRTAGVGGGITAVSQNKPRVAASKPRTGYASAMPWWSTRSTRTTRSS